MQYIYISIFIALFSTIAQFGSTEDIALSELKIEMLFPSDEGTKLMLDAMAQQITS